MKNKILLIVFLFLMMAGLLFSFFLFVKLQETNAKLETSNLNLEKTNSALEEAQMALKLEKEKNDSIKKQQNVAAIQEALTQLPATGKTANPAKPDVNLVKKREVLQAKLDFANYFVGVYSLGGASDRFNQTVAYLDDKGYSTITKVELDARPSWLAQTSTVFYYDPSTKNLAANLAKGLETATGTKFAVSMGAGLGVPKDKKAQYFYVHLMDERRPSRTNR